MPRVSDLPSPEGSALHGPRAVPLRAARLPRPTIAGIPDTRSIRARAERRSARQPQRDPLQSPTSGDSGRSPENLACCDERSSSFHLCSTFDLSLFLSSRPRVFVGLDTLPARRENRMPRFGDVPDVSVMFLILQTSIAQVDSACRRGTACKRLRADHHSTNRLRQRFQSGQRANVGTPSVSRTGKATDNLPCFTPRDEPCHAPEPARTCPRRASFHCRRQRDAVPLVHVAVPLVHVSALPPPLRKVAPRRLVFAACAPGHVLALRGKFE